MTGLGVYSAHIASKGEYYFKLGSGTQWCCSFFSFSFLILSFTSTTPQARLYKQDRSWLSWKGHSLAVFKFVTGTSKLPNILFALLVRVEV